MNGEARGPIDREAQPPPGSMTTPSDTRCEPWLRPLLDRIDGAYRTLHRRPPSPDEVAECLDRFEAASGSPATLARRATSEEALAWIDVRPLKVEMDVVNQCNLRCRMCHFSDPAYDHAALPKREMTVAEFESIASQLFAHCAELSLSISTEPLLHARVSELLAITNRYRVPWTYLHTNGLLLNERVARALIESGIDQLSVSIDGATAQTYESLRRGARLDTLLANLRRFQELVLELGADGPRLAFNVVLTRRNVHELPDLVRLAAQLGVVAVAGVHLVPLSEAMAEETLDRAPGTYDRWREEALSVGDELGVEVTLPPPFGAATEPGERRHRDLPSTAPSSPDGDGACCFPWHFLGIDSAGNVSPCGWWHRQPHLGNLLEQSFDEVWNGEGFRALRREHRSGALREACERCPSSGMGRVDDARSFEVR